MATSWGWIGPYIIVIILAILVGPILAALPLFTHTLVPKLGMSADQALRLLADSICLLMVWLAAHRAYHELQDTGKGQTLVRAHSVPGRLILDSDRGSQSL